MSTRYRLIVFDLDGTLVDSRRDIAESANALLAECGGDSLSEESIGRMVGDGAATLVARAFAAASRAQPPDALDRFLTIYNRRLLKHTRSYPGMHAVLTELGLRASLAVLTNKPIEATRRILAGLDLARYFPEERVYGGDGPFPPKPDPAGLQHLAANIGVEAGETVLIGDSIVDWRTARAAAVHICLARYGFGFEDFPSGELGPQDGVIDDPLQLLRVL